MNAPLLFMLLPLAGAAFSFFAFPVRIRPTILLASALSAGMAWAASAIPLDAPLTIFHSSLFVSGTFTVLGRRFVFDPSMRSAVMFLFIGGAGLFGGSLATPPNRLLLPVGMIVLGLFSASLFVQPFLYAAFFLFLSVLMLSLLLSDPSHPAPRGSVRWISYSALGMLFLLLAGSGLSSMAESAFSPAAVESILLQLCLGFGLLLSFPPFHFWLPDVVDDSSPYSVSFILSLYIGAVVFFLLRFLDGFDWLRQAPEMYIVLKFGGAGMCLVGAFFSVFQNRLGRCLGYLSLCNLGAILFSLSLSGPISAQTTMVLLAARGVSLLVWGVSFHALRPKQSMDRREDLRGIAFQQPLAFTAALLSGLSLVGAPGLISFPPFWAVLRSLSSSNTGFPFPMLPFFCLLFSLLAGVVSIYRFASPMLHFSLSSVGSLEKSRLLRLFLISSIALLFLLGLFPQLYIPWVANTATAFSNIMGMK